MFPIARILLVVTAFAILPLPAAAGRPGGSGVLSQRERTELAYAARLAAHSPSRAAGWLRRLPGVVSADLGPDRSTLLARFRDGAEGAVLPRTMAHVRLPLRSLRDAHLQSRAGQSAPAGRAVVMEPFADELGLGANAGQAEADTLAQAGYAVDVLRNSAVTVESMEAMSSYSFVYLETHSGALPGGDAVVMTGSTNNGDYPQLFADHSLLQAYVAGDPSRTLYNGITSHFVADHLGAFPGSSIVFVNGCNLLGAFQFWGALQKQAVTTFLAWDNDVDSAVTEPDAQFVVQQLAHGDNVNTALAAATAEGYGQSDYAGTVAHLGFLGDGSDTLARAMGLAPGTATATETATPSPTATATATPRPTATPKPKRKHAVKCKTGKHRVHGKCVPNKPKKKAKKKTAHCKTHCKK